MKRVSTRTKRTEWINHSVMTPVRWTISLLVCCWAAGASADLLVLSDGESLSGQTVRIDEGVLVFRTSLAGQMMVPVDTLRTLTTDANLMLTMRDDQVLYGRLAVKEDQPCLRPIDGGEARPIDLANVVEALPIPSPPSAALESPDSLAAWKASLETGVQQRTGNQTYADAFGRVRLSRESEKSSFRSDLLLERADADDFPRLFRGESELLRRGDRPSQPFAAFQAERDTSAALALRTGLSLGLSHALASGGGQSLEALTGVNVAYEEWDAADLRESQNGFFLGEDRSSSGSELNLHLSLRYARAFLQNSTLTSGLTLFPALSDLGDLRARTETAFSLPLTQRLQLRLNLLVDFDNDPQFRAMKKWGASVGAGINVDF
jgi:hypothetical protein